MFIENEAPPTPNKKKFLADYVKASAYEISMAIHIGLIKVSVGGTTLHPSQVRPMLGIY
jgi:hypothetical protein